MPKRFSPAKHFLPFPGEAPFYRDLSSAEYYLGRECQMTKATSAKTSLFSCLTILAVLFLSPPAQAERGVAVAVIAHSVSTSIEARDVRRRQGWTETSLRDADAILVVCRSELNWPLQNSYESVAALNEDADSQLNISGSNFHVYIYRINSDLSVDEVMHVNYPADD